MQPALYWIDLSVLPWTGRLAIMARPRAGDWLEDEIAGWRAEGVDEVISLLELAEVQELALMAEERLCQAQGIAFTTFPMPDRGVPDSRRRVAMLARRLSQDLASGRSVAVHCRAGIGRSSLLAASVLACAGLDVTAAFARIALARGVPVPDTDEQHAWVRSFAEALPLLA
ncbi:protein-tyrosine phosphatase family protein [Nitrospirillum sp. BR 11828]|uniref:phosphatase domain-containing putative toxin n=1 Tax=Nitrospirillum sp. BR 11828 TaxID=3104325 RepID=UPI002ACA2E5F|nr:protein-tyrosine phosphatase family protein [Nitrospirillum sp. BR 11828]MDZ5649400.1 protein-tyrosine phosphatase family protein [Nitrospirillum sp. BR 11828]